MTTEQELVKQWMQKFGQETPEKSYVPSLEIRKLRAKLILEEALETIEGLGFNIALKDTITHEICNRDSRFIEAIIVDSDYHKPNLEAIADGLADLHYVGYCGTAVACGLDMEPIFKEVHRSNKSKLWKYNELGFAEDAGHKVRLVSHKECFHPFMDEARFLVKNQDGKIIKSPSYSPANLKPIIESQMK